MTCFVLRAGGALALVVLAGCSSTAIAVTHDDAGVAEPDAGDAPVVDAGAPDAGPTDAGAPDAGPPEVHCFEDVELVRLRGGREFVGPGGIFEYEDGWVVTYNAFSHDSPGGQFATFLDREGRVTGTQTLWFDQIMTGAVLGRYILAWQNARVELYEIGENELIDRSDRVDLLPPSWIHAVVKDVDRLRILSSTWIDPTNGSFRFSYSELVLGDDGELSLRTGALEPVETLGSPGMVSGLTLYHAPHTFVMHEDTLFFAFPTGEGMFDIEGHPWNVMRLTLDRSALDAGVASWSLVDEHRWEDGPVSLFGAFPELDVAVAGWFRPVAGGYWPAITLERWTSPGFPSIPLNEMSDSSTDSLGPASIVRRGDAFGLHSAGRFRVFALPSFGERASAVLDLLNSAATWGDDEVIELGSIPTSDGLVGIVRCHPLLPSE